MKKPRFNLKAKLLLFSVVILFIPWIGYKYVRGMETFLKTSQEDSISTKAESIATILQQQPGIFDSHDRVVDINTHTDHLYLRPLDNLIQLDGYSEDWELNLDLFNEYTEQHIIHKQENHKAGTIKFKHAAGSYKQYLYTIFKVSDEQIIYHNPVNQDLNKSDHLRISMQTPSGDFKRYYLSTSAPGKLNAQLMSNDPENTTPVRPENLIQGAWQETADGYILEVRIPLSMIGNKLAFAIGDIDRQDNKIITTIIGTSPTDKLSELATIMIPSTKLDYLLHRLSKNSSRIWIVDNTRRVLALAGNLRSIGKTDNNDKGVIGIIMSALYRLILQQPVTSFEDILSGASKLQGREIDTALSGDATASWRATSNKNVTILTATYPIKVNNEVIGAVMLEQNSNRILLLQNQAMEELMNLSIPVFLGGTLIIIIFAGRLTRRIHLLRNQTEQAISADGRIAETFKPSSIEDEIGDLSRTFSDMLARLHEYNRYLETIASKLSHELRTPLTVVRSSLDNLEQINPDTNSNTYMQRARDGVERLDNILTRLSEATRLEQALQQTEKETIDLVPLITSCIDGYRVAYAENCFKFECPAISIKLLAAPELIVQMLDKLISNAIDFTSPQEAINITITNSNKQAMIHIQNRGPHLPASMQDNLFDSMISVREQKKGTAHLGLGLYIVRLIAEYHHGNVTAENCNEPKGVKFTISLPKVT